MNSPKYRHAALLLTAVSMFAYAETKTPPLEVKGVPMGATRQVILAKLPGVRCYPNGCFLTVSSANPKYNFGSAPLPHYGFLMDDHDRVGRVDIDIGQPWFADVIAELTEKFGASTTKMTDTFGRVVTWVRDDSRITAMERYASHSRITFSTKSYDAMEVDRATKARKDGAKKL